ncbi:hypothetical protein D8X75_07325 [Vibrio cholerae]|nr:hypothetical protein [Vibrio cholerae]EGR1400529.1 hypothetical protein [Vibrio cholerae]EGR1427465.1 hypothetical protein [Vibrio cholerae]PAR74878.1 hypothetical protein CGT87_16030 [Vibrio cholerae]
MSDWGQSVQHKLNTLIPRTIQERVPRDLPKSDEPNKNENVSNLVLRIVCQYFFLALKNATH